LRIASSSCAGSTRADNAVGGSAQLSVTADRSLDQVAHSGEQRHDIDIPRAQRLPPGKGQQSGDQRPCTLGAVQRGLHQPQPLWIVREPSLQHVEPGNHRCQKIVEIMRDTARHPAECSHSLAFGCSLLAAALRRHVAADECHQRDRKQQTRDYADKEHAGCAKDRCLIFGRRHGDVNGPFASRNRLPDRHLVDA
jgi:hypothetical protein